MSAEPARSLDLGRARSAVKRGLSRAPVQLAEGFARIVRSAPDARLERVLSTPVRRAVLEGIFWQMPQHLDRRAAKTMDATIRWRITSGSGDADADDAADAAADVYELTVKDGRCHARRGAGDAEPNVTITLDGAEFVKLATGNSDPMQAYFKGRLQLAGDIMVAARLRALFRIPGRSNGSQPSSTVSSSR